MSFIIHVKQKNIYKKSKIITYASCSIASNGLSYTILSLILEGTPVFE